MSAAAAIDPLFGVRDRVVVLTGGMGQLGRQYARTLLDRGARVAIFDLNAADAPVGLREFADPAQLTVHAVDVTRRVSIEEGLALVEERWGVPHALINNAALDSPPGASAAENGPFEEYPEASWDRVMEVNAKGVFLCCQVIGGRMAAAGRGSIINISSIYGVVSPDQRIYEYRRQGGEAFVKPVAYSASKSALFNLTRYLATYWAERGVRVNTLTLAGVFNNQGPAFLAAYERKVPLGRMADETDYNGAILFLLSDASRYMTGSNLVIDGGFTAW
jgi:NAD(P)-dependent dehydrogenase (short-subunit alcohol dehydrogenase family)